MQTQQEMRNHLKSLKVHTDATLNVFKQLLNGQTASTLLSSVVDDSEESREDYQTAKDNVFEALELLLKSRSAFLARRNMEEEIHRMQNKELQRLRQRRSKKKNKVDTRASKGRKTRYVTIEKLVNFFPATPEQIPWSHEKRDELFKSLFASYKA